MYSPIWQELSSEAFESMLVTDFRDEATDAGREFGRLRQARLPFYTSHSLIAIADTRLPEPNEHYFLWRPGSPAVRLDWTNEPIYRTNEVDGMRLVRSTIVDYVRFFYHFVRGQLGRFQIVEHVDQVPWLAEADARERGLEQIEKAGINIGPVRYFGLSDAHDLHILQAEMVFNSALFRTDILVAPYRTRFRDPEDGEIETFTPGMQKLRNEVLLTEGMPVIVDGPPGEFG